MPSSPARSLFAVLLLVCAVDAWAQDGLRDRDPNLDATRKITSDLQSAGLHRGPFFLISRLQLSDIGYDEHFFMPADGPGGLRWSVSAPQRLYFVPTRKVVASVDVTPSFAIISKGGKRTQIGYSSRADLQFLFNHLWFDFHTGLFNDLRAKTGEINSVLTTKDRSVGMNGEFKYSSRTSATFSGDVRRLSYPTNRFQPESLVDEIPLLDRSEHDYRVTLRHRTFPLTTISLASEYSDYTFAHIASHNARRTYGAVGAAYDNGRTSAWLEAGEAALSFRDPTQNDYRGVLGNGTLSRKFGTRTTLTVNAVRDLDFSIFLGNNYYLSDRAGATVDLEATRRLRLRLISQEARDLYPNPFNGIRRRDNLSWNAVGWNYVLRHVQGGFDVGYYKRTSNLGFDENHGIRLLLHLSLAL